MNCEGHYTTKKYIAGQILVFLFSMFKNFARHIPAWDIPGLSLNERSFYFMGRYFAEVRVFRVKNHISSMK